MMFSSPVSIRLSSWMSRTLELSTPEWKPISTRLCVVDHRRLDLADRRRQVVVEAGAGGRDPACRRPSRRPARWRRRDRSRWRARAASATSAMNTRPRRLPMPPGQSSPCRRSWPRRSSSSRSSGRRTAARRSATPRALATAPPRAAATPLILPRHRWICPCRASCPAAPALTTRRNALYVSRLARRNRSLPQAILGRSRRIQAWPSRTRPA